MTDTTCARGHYLGRSWHMLTQDSGWWKPIMVLALVEWIPIIGTIGVIGYIMGWIRLTAWGIDSAPKQCHVSVGGCLSSGWTAFVVSLGWGLVGGLVAGLIVGAAPMLLVLVWIALLFYKLVVMVAVVRAAIYQRIGPGYGLSQIFDMAGRDFGGLMSVLAIELLEMAILFGVCIVLTCVFAAALAGPISQLFVYLYYSDASSATLTPAIIDLIAQALGWLGPIICVVGYIFSIISVTFGLLEYNAVALWIRQFDVPAWGASADPVPPSIPCAPYLFGEPEQGADAMSPTNPASVPYDPNAKPKAPAPEEFVGAPEDVGEPVIPPTAEDLYDVATKKTTQWTEVVDATPDATFHMAWPEDGETRKPKRTDQRGVKPPTAGELYSEISGEVSRTWPDVGLEASNAVPAMDDAEMAAAVNEAIASESIARGETPPAPEISVAEAQSAPKPSVAQSPVTPPTPEDLYEDATAATLRWTQVVTPPESGTGELPEEKGGETVEPPVPRDGGGVDAPGASELYADVSSEVSRTWPDVDLEATNAVSSIDNTEVKEAVDEAIDALHKDETDGEDVIHLI